MHYYDVKRALKDVEINDNFKKLYKKLCPGPITFILKKKTGSKIHPLVCAKLNSCYKISQT